MKKFKLIKEYPNSPELGSIACNKSKSMYEIYIDNIRHKVGLNCFEVENQAEYWEEIVEKEYEILSYRNKLDSQQVLFSKPDWDKNFFIHPNWEIHSVKRLSDGEIFTIGDPIIAFASTDCCITKINLSSNGIVQFELTKFKDMDLYQPTVLLKNAKKARQKLFTTKDGVDIFKGDTYYYIEPHITTGQLIVAKMSNPNNVSDFYTRAETFHSKEKAIEYIVLNKPCLSVNDIFRDWSLLNRIVEKDDLMETVRRRLKL